MNERESFLRDFLQNGAKEQVPLSKFLNLEHSVQKKYIDPKKKKKKERKIKEAIFLSKLRNESSSHT